MGVYEKNRLIRIYEREGKTSELLPLIFKEILQEYRPVAIAYAKGPGSYMAIKVSYLFLKTLSIVYDLPFYATDGFAFNNRRPIKAAGSLYFIKKDGRISTQKLSGLRESTGHFSLPEFLDISTLESDTAPMYLLPAV